MGTSGNRQKLPFQSDTPIIARAPINTKEDGTCVVLNDVAGASSTFKVFDPAKDEAFSAVEAIAETVWSVTNAGLFVVGDQVEATQDDGTLITGTLTAVDSVLGTITSDTALTVAAAAGNRVRVKLGPTVVMAEFGTANVNTRTWGYSGSLASDHLGLVLGLEIDIEVSFVGSAGGALDVFERICAVMALREECC